MTTIIRTMAEQYIKEKNCANKHGHLKREKQFYYKKWENVSILNDTIYYFVTII